MLVIRWLHVAAQLVCRGPKLGLETEVCAVIVCLLSHLVLSWFVRRESRFPADLLIAVVAMPYDCNWAMGPLVYGVPATYGGLRQSYRHMATLVGESRFGLKLAA